jgi:hypothetical protein
MVVIGERLGLYKALAAHPMTSDELAAKTVTDERYVREWLASQAAGRLSNDVDPCQALFEPTAACTQRWSFCQIKFQLEQLVSSQRQSNHFFLTST